MKIGKTERNCEGEKRENKSLDTLPVGVKMQGKKSSYKQM